MTNEERAAGQFVALDLEANRLRVELSEARMTIEDLRAQLAAAKATKDCPHDAFATPATCRKCWALAGKVIAP